ncbi:MAG: methyltransferase domain-containing protein [Rhodobacteraceae bacterium]|nr:methyltransferase domain-containing protein [Paracoccaceae bacterium]
MARPGFQCWAARFPLTSGMIRRDGEVLFDLVAGFIHSQVLAALLELRVIETLQFGPARIDVLALAAGADPVRMAVLLRAGGAIDLIKRTRSGKWKLTRRGAVLPGIPGLAALIAHHRVLYDDLSDPAAFFRRGGDTGLSQFWPYVFGAAKVQDSDTAECYSRLMTDSQALVAEETLDAVSLKGVRHLMDVGGGAGAFLEAVAARYPGLDLTLVDLPPVVQVARTRSDNAKAGARITLHPANFRYDPLPAGADAISLIRVLYDHGDDTVQVLLDKVFALLPPDGRLIVSEPMLGTRAGDAYFAVYTLAMGTGRTRSASEISAFLAGAGFRDVTVAKTRRPFVTTAITARKPDS